MIQSEFELHKSIDEIAQIIKSSAKTHVEVWRKMECGSVNNNASLYI